MIKKFINRIIVKFMNRVFTSDRYNWKMTDHIMKVDEEIANTSLPASTTDNDEEKEKRKSFKYTCLRSYSNLSVYIESDKVEKFKALSHIYNADFGFINITNINTYRLFMEARSYIASRVTPPIVKIQLITCAKIDDVKVFVINIIDLEQHESLYKDLISYKLLNERYKIQ